jgi:hypothetical protein
MLKLFTLIKREKAAPARRPQRSSSVRMHAPITPEDWARERDPQRDQDQVLNNQVLAWLACLPPQARPSALCSQYPRVANRIALCWTDPRLCEQLFDSLLVSRRGLRRGFPPPVATEILRLRSLHAKRLLGNGNGNVAPMWDATFMATNDR